MEESVVVPETISYTLKRSRRSRYMRLVVQPGGVVVLTVPWGTHEKAIMRFVERQSNWIARAVRTMASYIPLPTRGRRAYLKHREAAREFIKERVDFWSAIYKISYKRIAIRDTKARWGSCSREGNLNFSYALLFLPKELADYVIVHEICHLKEHNHSKGFWQLVECAIPDYKLKRTQLRHYAL
jgi:predicted metal-dependent hydrolase